MTRPKGLDALGNAGRPAFAWGSPRLGRDSARCYKARDYFPVRALHMCRSVHASIGVDATGASGQQQTYSVNVTLGYDRGLNARATIARTTRMLNWVFVRR